MSSLRRASVWLALATQVLAAPTSFVDHGDYLGSKSIDAVTCINPVRKALCCGKVTVEGGADCQAPYPNPSSLEVFEKACFEDGKVPQCCSIDAVSRLSPFHCRSLC